MQNTIQKFRQGSIVFEKAGIYSENLKTLTSSNYPAVLNIFFWYFSHVSYLPMSTKGCVGFFFLFRSWVICKNYKRPGFYTLAFYIFINNSRSKQNKKTVHSFL